MATTYVDICNSALTRIGIPIISSFSDGTKQANACSNRWQQDRDIVLRMHPWTCATQRVILAPSATAPAFDYPLAFPLPSDYLRLVEISPQPWGSDRYMGARSRYKIESGFILYDWNPLYLRYVAQVTNATQLDSLCENAIALYIAFDLSQLLLQNENLTKQLNQEFEGIMASARNVNGDEQQSCMVIDTFDKARLWGPS